MASGLALIVVSVLVLCISAEDVPECNSNNYYERSKGECVQCSECYGNVIIREVCEGDRDTVCGPFVEFEEFQQRPIDNSKNITIERIESSIAKDEDRYTKYPTEINDQKWYTLAMALLGIISVVALFVGAYIIAVCFVCKKPRQEKEIIYDPEEFIPLPPSPNNRSRLVERYSAFPSRDRLKRKRQNYTKEDKGTVPPLVMTAIGDDYDADNSGQTVSSTSSHYVYFKSAEPPN